MTNSDELSDLRAKLAAAVARVRELEAERSILGSDLEAATDLLTEVRKIFGNHAIDERRHLIPPNLRDAIELLTNILYRKLEPEDEGGAE